MFTAVRCQCVKDNEGHRDGRIIREYDSENVDTTVHTTPNTAVNCFRTATSDTYHTISGMNDIPDDTVVTPNKLKAKLSEYNNLNVNLTPTTLIRLALHCTD